MVKLQPQRLALTVRQGLEQCAGHIVVDRQLVTFGIIGTVTAVLAQQGLQCCVRLSGGHKQLAISRTFMHLQAHLATPAGQVLQQADHQPVTVQARQPGLEHPFHGAVQANLALVQPGFLRQAQGNPGKHLAHLLPLSRGRMANQLFGGL
ncbi:hypothetical protein D3C84_691930 [compost metagenome]